MQQTVAVLSKQHKRFGISILISCFLVMFLACVSPVAAQIVSYSRQDMGVSVCGQNGSRLYGINQTSGHWVYSDNSGDSWIDVVYSAVNNPASGVIQLVFHGGYMFAVTDNGKIYRNQINSFNNWTNVSVSALPANTTGRVDELASNGAYLFYGNYNTDPHNPGVGARVYRSTDNGNSWAQVLNAPNGRHVHAVAVDPANPNNIFVTIGDATYSDEGLWYSGSAGEANSFRHLSSNRYGIDMAFPLIVPSNVPHRLLMEGDGLAQPHIISYNLDLLGSTNITEAVVVPDTHPADNGSSWAGTARGIRLTAEGNLFWISTGENGTAGTRNGIWFAQGPLFNNPVLLEEITTTWPANYGKTYESGMYLINGRYRMRHPMYASTPMSEIDLTEFFVRQQYLDFLNREPDQSGFNYWTSQISSCAKDDARCTNARRIAVSAAFFIEQEFQQTGNFIYRLYKASYGTVPGYANFMTERSRISSNANLQTSKEAFTNEWVARNAFLQAYPSSLTPEQFVNRLFDTAQLAPYTQERQQEIAAMTNDGETRASVLRDVVEIQKFKDREYNRAFVLMQYFGYLRRDPDQAGYDFWIDILNNKVPGNFRSMVCAFLTSAEYQKRFGSIISHTNADCGN